MKVLELFAGTRSIGKAFERKGHEVFSVEWNKCFSDIDLYEDILKVQAEDIIKKFGRPDVIWASPDCSSYSIAAISHHRKQDENGNLSTFTNVVIITDICKMKGLNQNNTLQNIAPSQNSRERNALQSRKKPGTGQGLQGT